MDKHQKGFSSILLVIIALAVVGGGVLTWKYKLIDKIFSSVPEVNSSPTPTNISKTTGSPTFSVAPTKTPDIINSGTKSLDNFVVPSETLMPKASDIGESFKVYSSARVDESKETPPGPCPFTEMAKISYVTSGINEDQYTVLIVKCRSVEKAVWYYDLRWDAMGKYGAEEFGQFGDSMFGHYVCTRGACQPLKKSMEFRRGVYNVQILSMESGVRTILEKIAAAVDKKLIDVIASDKAIADAIARGEQDEHGCIGTLGYFWCEPKKKCLEVGKENCYSDTKSELQYQLALRYGKQFNDVIFKPAKVEGDYMLGRLSFSNESTPRVAVLAVETGNVWKLVYDGRGNADCGSIKNNYKFPSDMLAEVCD